MNKKCICGNDMVPRRKKGIILADYCSKCNISFHKSGSKIIQHSVSDEGDVYFYCEGGKRFKNLERI